MYVITIITPSNTDPNKNVKTYYVGQVQHRGLLVTDWDEDIAYAKIFPAKIEAKVKQSELRRLVGSERCKIELRNKFSKN